LEKIIKQAARSLRKDLTPAEKLLWERLRYKQLEGHKFRRQQALGRFVADFVCLDKRVIIELDGGYHSYQKERDAERDNYLIESGYKVIRFHNSEVEQDIDGVIKKIEQKLKTPPSPNPSPAGGEGV
jgi:very-short-patch-repair endonuclease